MRDSRMAPSGIAGILATVLLAVIGLLMVALPKKMVGFQIWTQKTLMDAQYIPGRKTERMMQLAGILVLLIALLAAYRVATKQAP